MICLAGMSRRKNSKWTDLERTGSYFYKKIDIDRLLMYN